MKAFLFVAFLLLFCASSVVLLGADLRLPDELQKCIQTLKEAPKTRKGDNLEFRKNASQLIYKWLEEQMRSHSANEILSCLSEHLMVSTNEHLTTWRQRLDFQNTNTEPRLSIIFWQTTNKEVLGVRLDSFDNKLREPGYSSSSTPFIIAKEGSFIKSFAIYDRGLGSFAHTFHGFIGGAEADQWPDIIISEGPAGSANFVYWSQFHLDVNKRWNVVWDHNCPHVASVDYHSRSGALIVEFHPDRFDDRIQRVTNVLIWGGNK